MTGWVNRPKPRNLFPLFIFEIVSCTPWQESDIAIIAMPCLMHEQTKTEATKG